MEKTLSASRQNFPAGLFQPEHGFRFGSDSLQLSEFALELGLSSGAAVADLGTGCGVIALGLGLKRPDLKLVGVEQNPDMAACAVKNATLLGVERFSVIMGDIDDPATLLRARRALLDNSPEEDASSVPLFDAVLCNPPWRLLGKGRLPPEKGRCQAMFGDGQTLSMFFNAADKLLKSRGSLGLVCGADRLEDVLLALPRRLKPFRLRFVHGMRDCQASGFLLEARKNSRAPLRVEPPIMLHQG